MSGMAVVRKQGQLESPKQKILLVDDNADVLRSMTAVLESLDEEILIAENANAALKHLLKIEPAVIVLDVMMPEVDGFQLATMIRKRERFRHTPIIFLTGLGREDRSMLQGYQAGAVDFLLKPVDPDVLRYKVKIFVDLARQASLLKGYADAMQAKSGELRTALDETLRAKKELEAEMAERRRVEAKRDQLAGRLGATPDFVSAMAEGAVTLDFEGNVLYSNGRFCEMLDRSESQLLGTKIESFCSANSVEEFRQLFEESKNRRVTAEMELSNSEGHLIPVQLTMNPFATENLQAVALVITDLRDQKRSEQLIAEGRLARLIFQQAHAGMAVCDSHGRIVLANATMHQLCGENVLFKDFDTVLPLEIPSGDSTRAFSCFEVLGGQQYRTTEVRFQPSLRNVELLMNASRIQSDDGITIGALISLVDISERKSIEEALRRSEKLASAGRIAGSLAHEINNPLSAVTNILYLLQHSELDETRQHYVDLASSELARISNIVRRTLSFYRESARPVPLHLTEILDNVLEVYGRHITTKSIRITKNYSFQDTIYGFPGELRQVFSNLVANAIDALSSDQELIIRVRASRHPKTGCKGVRITIADRGHGIPKESMKNLFEPFFTTKGERGTGLGLWVTQGIIQKQGGTISVRSSDKENASWTAFSVLIPVEATPALQLDTISVIPNKEAVAANYRN